MSQNLKLTTPTDHEIMFTRTFDAPRPIVWETMTKPEYLERWATGPAGWTMSVCEEDLRVGGRFRWVIDGPDQLVLTMTGEYHEINAPERSTRIERFELGGMMLGEHLATVILAEDGRQTHLTIILQYTSKEGRDAAIASGMEQGMSVGYSRLDAILAGLAVNG